MENTFDTLTKLIKTCSNVIIMTHSKADLDGFGSSICLYSIVKQLKKECFVLINTKNEEITIQNARKKLSEKEVDIQYIHKNKVKKIIDVNTLLIVLDTHKISMVEDKNLLKQINKIVVLDHHIKNRDYISNTVLNYINSTISSTVELVTKYVMHLNVEINPLIATIMLAGLELDTNSYNVKTTDKTYEIASFLSKMGADNYIKQELMKENKDKYLKRQFLLKNAYMINETCALCILNKEVYESSDLAKMSGEMLQFEDVEASFTIGKLDDITVGISARSLGKIDVEKIMKQFNGGGHLTDAAAQIKNISIKEAKEKLIKIIEVK